LTCTIAFLGIAVAYAGFRASVKLHDLALQKILMAPMSFFDTNPLGRIVNRFSRDVAEIDRWLVLTLRGSMNLMVGVVCNLALIAYAVPVAFAVIAPILPVYYFVQKFYRNASRELKRLEAIERSPVFTNFSESLMGE
jgi:ABC-type multidrug transport system fused ATPase/permease subunit